MLKFSSIILLAAGSQNVIASGRGKHIKGGGASSCSSEWTPSSLSPSYHKKLKTTTWARIYLISTLIFIPWRFVFFLQHSTGLQKISKHVDLLYTILKLLNDYNLLDKGFEWEKFPSTMTSMFLKPAVLYFSPLLSLPVHIFAIIYGPNLIKFLSSSEIFLTLIFVSWGVLKFLKVPLEEVCMDLNIEDADKKVECFIVETFIPKTLFLFSKRFFFLIETVIHTGFWITHVLHL